MVKIILITDFAKIIHKIVINRTCFYYYFYYFEIQP